MKTEWKCSTVVSSLSALTKYCQKVARDGLDRFCHQICLYWNQFSSVDIPSSQKLHIFIHDICQFLDSFPVLNQPRHFQFPFSSTCSSSSFQASDYHEKRKFENDQPIKSKHVNVKKMSTCPGRTNPSGWTRRDSSPLLFGIPPWQAPEEIVFNRKHWK